MPTSDEPVVLPWKYSVGGDSDVLSELSQSEIEQCKSALQRSQSISVQYPAYYPDGYAKYVKDAHAHGADTTVYTLKEMLRDIMYDINNEEYAVIRKVGMKALFNLLHMGDVASEEFLKSGLLQQCIRDGKQEIIWQFRNWLKSDPELQQLLQKRNFFTTHASYNDITLLHMMVALNDIKALNSSEEFQEIKNSEKVNTQKLQPLLECAGKFDSKKVTSTLEELYFRDIRTPLEDCLIKGLKKYDPLDTKGKNAIKDDMLKILAPMSFKQDQSDIRQITGSIIRAAAKMANHPLSWKQKVMQIKDIIKAHLSNTIGWYQDSHRVKNLVMREPGLKDSLKTLKEEKDNAKINPSATPVQRYPSRGTVEKN